MTSTMAAHLFAEAATGRAVPSPKHAWPSPTDASSGGPGQRRQAAERLRTARTGFVRLGARPYLEHVDDELAAFDLRPPDKSRRGDPLQLTPRQADVARLVARGLSNKEVATELYISPHAVGYHLRHIYAKLDVTTRQQLRQRLASASI